MSTLSDKSFTAILKEGESEKETRLVGLEIEDGTKFEVETSWNTSEDEDRIREFLRVGKAKYNLTPAKEWEEPYKTLYDLKNVAGWGLDGGGLEIMTQPYSINILKEGGDEDLQKLFEWMNKNMHPLNLAGTHINISKLPTDSKQTSTNLWWLSIYFGEQLRKVFGRRSTWAQVPQDGLRIPYTTPAAVKALHEIAGKQATHEADYNLKARFIATKSNRYEFRAAKATINKEEALAWVELAANMLEAAATDRVDGITLGSLLEGPHLTKYVAENCNTRERIITKEEMEMVSSKTMRIKLPTRNSYRVYNNN